MIIEEKEGNEKYYALITSVGMKMIIKTNKYKISFLAFS